MGTAAALVTADWIRSLLFGLQPGDPTTFALASLVVVLAGLAGSVLRGSGLRRSIRSWP